MAAPAIRKDLGGSYADLQWIAAAFAVSYLLPRQARRPHAPADFAVAEPALA